MGTHTGTYARVGLAGVGITCGVLLLTGGLGRSDGDGGGQGSGGSQGSGGGADAAQSADSAAKGPYVALGDSYTAGPKIPSRTGRPAGCERSDHNYPTLVAQKLKISAADFRDVSCSGATIADLSAPQGTNDGVNPAQLSALSASTRLVTLGIGANDIDFIALVKNCVKDGLGYVPTGRGTYTGDDAPCRRRYTSGGTDEVRQSIQAAGERLAGTLNAIKERSPQARVYVVGYPSILPDKGKGCDDDLTLAPDDATFLNDKEQQLNSALRQRAEAAGAGYVDTYTPSAGRDACSASGTRWIEPLLPAAPAASVHPNARGERGMADAVLRAVEGS